MPASGSQLGQHRDQHVTRPFERPLSPPFRRHLLAAGQRGRSREGLTAEESPDSAAERNGRTLLVPPAVWAPPQRRCRAG